jgi:sugar phosphate isomerase/epimerase
MIPALSCVTTLNATLAEDINACADAGCGALEVWLTKLENYLSASNPADQSAALKKLLAERQVKLIGAAYQGGALLTQGEERRVQMQQLQRRLSLCQEFGIGVLILVPDAAEALTQQMVQLAQSSLTQLAELASAFNVRLALEFSSRCQWCACSPTALALIQSVDSAHLGVCLDLFHYYTGPSKFEDLGLLTKDNLLAVQLSDLSGIAREMATDSDRIFPGEGDFLISPIIEHLKHIEYGGYVSVELMNPEIWKMKPVQVAEAAYSCLRLQLGQRANSSSLQEIE